MSDTEQELEQEQDKDSEKEHSHHHTHRHKSRIKPFLYSMLSFFLAFSLFLLSICMVLQMTVFSKDYAMNIMRSCGYYDMVSAELKSRMEDLVDASGFEKQFAEGFVRSYNVQKAVEDYVSAFYSGDSTLIDTTGFKQQLYDAIDVYIRDKNITVSDETQNNITYFVNEAAQVYVDQISIPFFSTIANYIFKARDVLNGVTISIIIFALITAALIFFTNEFKHRRFRYLFIGSTGAAVTIIVLPTFVLLSGKISKINIATRSLYSLFVNYFNTLFYNFYIWAGVLVLFSVVMLVLYVKHYRRATS